MGESYFDSAKLLTEHLTLRLATSELPLLYLLRHSTELFLKSEIIMLHRSLNIDFGGDTCNSAPKVIANGKWVSLFTVHDLSVLFQHFEMILLDNLEYLGPPHTRTRWEGPSNEFYQAFKTIVTYDNRSDFFRYPISKNIKNDDLKSDSAAFDERDFLAHVRTLGAEDFVKALMIDDASYNSEVFVWGKNHLSELRIALLRVAEDLSLYHFIMKCELTGGC